MTTANPLGRAALLTAIASAVIEVVATPVELALQLRGGAPFSAVVFVVAVLITVVAAVALVLGIVAVRRPLSPVAASAGIGVAAFVLVGQVGALVATLAAYAL